ncbi:MAG: hypothetical protein Kow0059_11210 [Candidatus Sumerlaeia bacterium]
MPVFEAAYRTWQGERRSGWHRLWAFPKFTFLQLSGKRSVQMVFVLAWLPFLAFLTFIYVSVNEKLTTEVLRLPRNILPPVDGAFFTAFVFCQLPFLFFFTLLMGPGLIATDLRHQALPMILSKPISRWQYLFGKFSVLFILLSALSWLPATILFAAQTAAVPAAHPWRVRFWSESLWLWPRTVALCLIVVVTLNLLVLMFSSLTQNSRFAGVALIMFIVGSVVVAPIATGIFGSERWMSLSPVANLITVAGLLLESGLKVQSPPLLAWGYFVLLWATCLIVLSRRVRAFHLFRE